MAGQRPPADHRTVHEDCARYIPQSLTDRGNARLFAQLHRHRFLHVDGLGWCAWDGHRWKRGGADAAVLWAVGDMAENLPENDPYGNFDRRELARHKRRTLSTAGIKSLLLHARAAPDITAGADTLDSDPYALCTPSGVVDLRTGLVRPPDPTRDRHSRATDVGPEDMPTPLWNRFLTDTFGDDTEGREMIGFLQLLLGYSITGDVGAQVLPFLHGQGRNGKSVLLDTMLNLMGDYADAAPPRLLMHHGSSAEHLTELAELHGRRLVVCSELNPSDTFDEARVKILTGGDRITARRMRQDYFSFTPTHKLWLIGNHRPEVSSGGFAFWRRIRLIPFDQIVPDDRVVDNLAATLVREEGPGIMRWLVEGALRYLSVREPLDGPDRVRVATTAYADTADHIGRFLDESCVVQGTGKEPARVEQAGLYAAYTRWCRAQDLRPVNTRVFAVRVRQELGLASTADMIRSHGRTYYPGLVLAASSDAQGTERNQSAVNTSKVRR